MLHHGERLGLCTSQKPESQEICFVPDHDYAGFVERIGGGSKSGAVVDAAGTVLAQHEGIHHFTVGQRKGLGLSSKLPLYVQRIEAESGTVVVGPDEALWSDTLRVFPVSWVAGAPPEDRTAVTVKIRNRHTPSAGTLTPTREGASVKLQSPARAITPGQAAVFYRGDEVLGGGFIRNAC